MVLQSYPDTSTSMELASMQISLLRHWQMLLFSRIWFQRLIHVLLISPFSTQSVDVTLCCQDRCTNLSTRRFRPKSDSSRLFTFFIPLLPFAPTGSRTWRMRQT